jgi:autotransporter translocation and assembly factor TamB
VSSQKTAANSIEIKVKADPLADESEGNIFLDFKRIKVKSGTGDIDVQFSGTGIFAQMEPAEVAVVGEGKGNLTVEVSNAKKIGENGGYTDSITIIESSQDA